jgi:hypothetical protein
VVTASEVGEVAASLPGITEGTSYGTRAWYVGKRIFLRLHDQPGVLVAWCADEHDKHSLLADDTDAYFSTAHYDGHASVLVRLDAVDRTQLRALVLDAYRARAPRRLLEQQESEG